MNDKVRLIQSLQRAFEILNCFNVDRQQLKLSEIAELVGIHINTTRGLVGSLVYYGYLNHLENANAYCLGPAFLDKAWLVRMNYDDMILNEAEPFLVELANRFEASARLQVVVNKTLYILSTKHPKTSHYFMVSRAGLDFPLNATSSGKLYLSYMDQENRDSFLNDIPAKRHTDHTITDKQELIAELNLIRERGYSKEDQEIEYGISSIAVPLISGGRFIGTISITASTAVIDNAETDAAKMMIDFAKSISTTKKF